jgi:mono/diheme cytochrome c family protein
MNIFRFLLPPMLLLLTSPGIGSSPAQNTARKATQTAAPGSHQGDIARGKYLVIEVARCQECHTPRDTQGELDTTRWLQGAPIWFTPTLPMSNFAEYAPAIAGFGGYTDQQGQDILERGQGPNGHPIRPPMHYYHMNHEDAAAIIAYLRSLPSTPR